MAPFRSLIPHLVNWQQVFSHTFIPAVGVNHETVTLLVAILGTTISPYLFFWQASMEVENQFDQLKRKAIKQWIVTKHEIRLMEEDVTLGMFLSNITMWFIIVTTALTLHVNNITTVETAHEAASALKPIAGDFAFLLFTLGIVGTGFLAIPVLAGSSSYVLAEAFGWAEGLNRPFHKARKFYLVIIASTALGLFINLFGFNPFRMLFYTAVIYGLVSPPLIAIILHIANNEKIMGSWKNSFWSNLLGGVTFLIMSLAAVFFLITAFGTS